MFRILITLAVLSLLCACGQKYDSEYGQLDEMLVFDAPEAAASSEIRMADPSGIANITPPVPKVFEKKIIKTGHISMESKNLAGSRKMLDSLVRGCDGYAASENFNDQGNLISYNLSYRIPAEKFDEFLAIIEKGPDKILSKSINAQDISEQYYDIQTRLENEKQVEKRYLELLKRANTVRDILDIEEKLGKVRQEIESKEGRLRFLDSQVSYSTLNIYIYQKKQLKYEPAERDGFGQRLVRSLHRGWQGFVDVILFFLKLWPLWLVGIGIWQFIAWLRRRSGKNRKQEKK